MTIKTNKCLTCDHPKLADIDAALREDPRKPFADIAAGYGLDRRTVARHLAKGHVAPAPSPDEDGEDHALLEEDPRDIVRRVMNELKSLNGLSPAVKIAQLDAIRRTAADLARSMPPSRPTTVAPEDIPGLLEVFEVIYGAMEKPQYVPLRKVIAEELKRRDLFELF